MSEGKNILNVIDYDYFLDLPLCAQALFFHLVMRANGSGRVDNARAITRMIRADKCDLDLLLDKAFIYQEDNDTFAISQWKSLGVDQDGK